MYMYVNDYSIGMVKSMKRLNWTVGATPSYISTDSGV